MDDYCFFFIHPYNLKKNFQREKQSPLFNDTHKISGYGTRYQAKLVQKKMFLPSFASMISFDSCINPMKWVLLSPLVDKEIEFPRN